MTAAISLLFVNYTSHTGREAALPKPRSRTMLNALHDLGHASALPTNVASAAAAGLLRSPAMALVPGLQPFTSVAAAAAEMIERATRRYRKPEWGLHHADVGGSIAAVRPRTVMSLPFCDLVRVERSLGGEDDPRVLVFAPLSGHWATLLRGTVEALLPGHDVYVTDWRDASDVPLAGGRFGLDGYVDYAIRFLRELGPETAVLAICQPAVPVLAAVSLMAAWGDPCQPRSMVLMGGPIDVAAAETAVTRLALERPLSWFEILAVGTAPAWRAGAGHRVYAGWRQLAGFMSMNALDHARKHADLFMDLVRGDGESADKTKLFYDEYMSVMDLDGEFYLDTIDRVFQRRLLALGALEWRGERVDPSATRRTALMTVEGAQDDICAPGQTLAAHALCSGLSDGQRLHHVQPGVGHYGIFNGRRWREEIRPLVAGFIRRHAGAA